MGISNAKTEIPTIRTLMRVQLIDGQFAWPIAGEELQKLQSQWLLAIGAFNAEMLPERLAKGKVLSFILFILANDDNY